MAEFVDLFLTPIAGGVGTAIGYGVVLRKNPQAEIKAVPKWVAVVAVGVLAAALLLAAKVLF